MGLFNQGAYFLLAQPMGVVPAGNPKGAVPVGIMIAYKPPFEGHNENVFQAINVHLDIFG
jgi:hypothetical protein